MPVECTHQLRTYTLKKGVDEKSPFIRALKQKVKLKCSKYIVFWLYLPLHVGRMKIERTKDIQNRNFKKNLEKRFICAQFCFHFLLILRKYRSRANFEIFHLIQILIQKDLKFIISIAFLVQLWFTKSPVKIQGQGFFSNKITRARFLTCSKIILQTQKCLLWRQSGIFIVTFDKISRRRSSVFMKCVQSLQCNRSDVFLASFEHVLRPALGL